MFFDTHAHMDHPKFNKDRQQLLKEIRDAGIGYILNPAIMHDSNFSMRDKLERFDFIYYAAGIHPNYVPINDEKDRDLIEELYKLIQSDKTIAVGETGLDFYRLSRNNLGEIDETGVITLSRQYKWFRKQIQLASMVGLPLILHIRNADEATIRESKCLCADKKIEHIDAHKEAIKILKEFQEESALEYKGVVHCFTSRDYEDAKAYIELGYMLGVGGAITYSDSVDLREIVRNLPLDSIILETDSPYVMPEGTSGKRNTPLNIPYIAKVVADIKKIEVTEVESVTTENAKKLFGL